MNEDILTLQSQMQRAHKGLDEQRAQLEESLSRADAKIDEVANALDAFNTAARRTDADFGVQLERLVREVQELRGGIELAEYRLGKVEALLEGPGSISERLDALEGNKGTVRTDALVNLPEDKAERISFAHGVLKKGDKEQARGIYRDIIRQWPKEPGITDAAYHKLGEIYFQEKEYRRSLGEFIKIVENFSSGRFVDTAYYHIGLCSLELGNLEDAKVFFQEVVQNHKKSPVHSVASQKLKQVNTRLERAKKGARR